MAKTTPVGLTVELTRDSEGRWSASTSGSPPEGTVLDLDAAAGALVLRADPFGARAVHWVQDGARLLVSTSARELHRRLGAGPDLDRRNAAAWLAGQPTTRSSLFARLRRLPPGHRLVASGTGCHVESCPRPDFEPRGEDAGHDEREREALEILTRAVASRLGDSPTCLLSGGLDSSVLLVLATRARRRVTAVTMMHSGEEPTLARTVAKRAGARHRVVELDHADLTSHAEDAVLACEIPVHGALAIAKHAFFARARLAGPVLSGLGADEVLAGAPDRLLPRADGLNALQRQAEADRALTARLLLPMRSSLLPPRQPSTWGCDRRGDALAAGQRRAIDELAAYTLPIETASAAAFGTDVRLPYLDAELIRLVSTWPRQHRARGGLGKLWLRRLELEELPDEVRSEPNAAQVAPAGRRPWLTLFGDTLTPSALTALDLVDAQRVGALLRDPAAMGERLSDAAVRVLFRLFSLVVLSRS